LTLPLRDDGAIAGWSGQRGPQNEQRVAGERLAAEAAPQRVRARVGELARHDPPIEQKFSLPAQWSRHPFLALCRRYGLRPFPYHRQRRNTVMIRASRGFVDKVLPPAVHRVGERCKSICTR